MLALANLGEYIIFMFVQKARSYYQMLARVVLCLQNSSSFPDVLAGELAEIALKVLQEHN